MLVVGGQGCQYGLDEDVVFMFFCRHIDISCSCKMKYH